MNNTNTTTPDTGAAHTAGELRLCDEKLQSLGYLDVRTEGGTVIFTPRDPGCYAGGTMQGNARELVRRWNAYPELVAALAGLVAELSHPMNGYGDPTAEQTALLEQARAALAKVQA